jgi:hypothetical protein
MIVLLPIVSRKYITCCFYWLREISFAFFSYSNVEIKIGRGNIKVELINKEILGKIVLECLSFKFVTVYQSKRTNSVIAKQIECFISPIIKRPWFHILIYVFRKSGGRCRIRMRIGCHQGHINAAIYL